MSDALSLAVDLATLLAVLAAAWQLVASRKQRQRDFESLFVQRYWSIIDGLSLASLEGHQPAGGEVTEQDRRAVIAYLRLCEDEIELWHRGWISREAWHEWRSGIEASLNRWPFTVVWAEVYDIEAGRGPDGQFAELRRPGHRSRRALESPTGAIRASPGRLSVRHGRSHTARLRRP